MDSIEVYITPDNIRYACIAYFWIEFATTCLIIGRQLIYLQTERWRPPELASYPQYTESIFHLAAMKMKATLWQDIKIKLFTTSIWTVTIGSDLIPFMWDNFQLADSDFDFTPDFLPLEMRQDISFGFWFALYELIILDFPVKFFQKQLLQVWGSYNKSMLYFVRQRFDETLLATMHQTLLSFVLSFFINIFDEQSVEYHEVTRHIILAVVYAGVLFIFDWLQLMIMFRDSEKYIPIQPQELWNKVAVICKAYGYPMDHVYIEVVPQEAPTNAYCYSYFGLYSRIAILSNLIEGYYDNEPGQEKKNFKSPGLTYSELEGIMAHEVGHWVLSHNEKRNIVFNILFEPLLFGLAIWLREQKIIYEAFHFSPSDLKSLPYPLLPGLFIAQQILLKPLTDIAGALWNHYGSAMEAEADAFAVPIGYGQNIKQGLVRLKLVVLGYPSSDPIYSFFYDHHPTLVERIRGIDNEIQKR